MGTFLLVLLTLNPRSGDLLSSAIVGEPYASITDCMRAAIDQGPLKAAGGKAYLLVCRPAEFDAGAEIFSAANERRFFRAPS